MAGASARGEGPSSNSGPEAPRPVMKRSPDASSVHSPAGANARCSDDPPSWLPARAATARSCQRPMGPPLPRSKSQATSCGSAVAPPAGPATRAAQRRPEEGSTCSAATTEVSCALGNASCACARATPAAAVEAGGAASGLRTTSMPAPASGPRQPANNTQRWSSASATSSADGASPPPAKTAQGKSAPDQRRQGTPSKRSHLLAALPRGFPRGQSSKKSKPPRAARAPSKQPCSLAAPPAGQSATAPGAEASPGSSSKVKPAMPPSSAESATPSEVVTVRYRAKGLLSNRSPRPPLKLRFDGKQESPSGRKNPPLGQETSTRCSGRHHCQPSPPPESNSRRCSAPGSASDPCSGSDPEAGFSCASSPASSASALCSIGEVCQSTSRIPVSRSTVMMNAKIQTS
mmetsp:Transcript_94337/g.270530  ORF Transcript_94337/g.270530 Transcript_94337/m.270530 type:complete len:404 (-) Transcript_94337:81-1292(-)